MCGLSQMADVKKQLFPWVRMAMRVDATSCTALQMLSVLIEPYYHKQQKVKKEVKRRETR
jgi:hypothetical protein